MIDNRPVSVVPSGSILTPDGSLQFHLRDALYPTKFKLDKVGLIYRAETNSLLYL
jgi:hypothetical protein